MGLAETTWTPVSIPCPLSINVGPESSVEVPGMGPGGNDSKLSLKSPVNGPTDEIQPKQSWGAISETQMVAKNLARNESISILLL